MKFNLQTILVHATWISTDPKFTNLITRSVNNPFTLEDDEIFELGEFVGQMMKHVPEDVNVINELNEYRKHLIQFFTS